MDAKRYYSREHKEHFVDRSKSYESSARRTGYESSAQKSRDDFQSMDNFILFIHYAIASLADDLKE